MRVSDIQRDPLCACLRPCAGVARPHKALLDLRPTRRLPRTCGSPEMHDNRHNNTHISVFCISEATRWKMESKPQASARTAPVMAVGRRVASQPLTLLNEQTESRSAPALAAARRRRAGSHTPAPSAPQPRIRSVLALCGTAGGMHLGIVDCYNRLDFPCCALCDCNYALRCTHMKYELIVHSRKSLYCILRIRMPHACTLTTQCTGKV